MTTLVTRRSLLAASAGAAIVPRVAKAIGPLDLVNSLLGVKQANAAGSVLIPAGSGILPFPEPPLVQMMPNGLLPNHPPAIINNVLQLGPIPQATRTLFGSFTFNMVQEPRPQGFGTIAYNIDKNGLSSMQFVVVGSNVPIRLGNMGFTTSFSTPTLSVTIGGPAGESITFLAPNIIDVARTVFQTVMVMIRPMANGNFGMEAAVGRQGSPPTLVDRNSIVTIISSGLVPNNSIPPFDIRLRAFPNNNGMGFTYGAANAISSAEGLKSPFAPRNDPGRYAFPGLIAQSIIVPSPNVANLETVLATNRIIDGGSRPVVLPPNGMIFPGSPSPPLQMLIGDPEPMGGFLFHLGNDHPFYEYDYQSIAFGSSASYDSIVQTVGFQNGVGYDVYYSPLQNPGAYVTIENIALDPTD